MKRAAIVIRQLEKTTGAARIAHANIRLLVDQGYQVDVYSEFIDKPAVEKSGGRPFKIFNLPLSSIYRRQKFLSKVQNKLRQKDYDLVLGNGDISEQDILFLHNSVFLASELIHEKELDPKNEMAMIHGKILREQSFKLLIANSEKMKNDLQYRFNIPVEKIHVVHPGYNARIFSNLDRQSSRKLLCQQLKISEEKKLLGFITSGNFKKRNLDFFIEAIGNLPAKLKQETEFLVVGKAKSFSKWQEIARQKDLRIHFLEPQSNVHQLFQAIDIFCLPAKWEEFGLVVLEAMASGCCCIISDKVGAGEVFPPEHNELILNLDSSKSYTDKIAELFADQKKLDSIGAKNVEIAKNYTEQKQASKFKQILLTKLS